MSGVLSADVSNMAHCGYIPAGESLLVLEGGIHKGSWTIQFFESFKVSKPDASHYLIGTIKLPVSFVSVIAYHRESGVEIFRLTEGCFVWNNIFLDPNQGERFLVVQIPDGGRTYIPCSMIEKMECKVTVHPSFFR